MLVKNLQSEIPDNAAMMNIAWKQEPSFVDALEAELNARVEALNQTAMVTITDLHGTILYANDLFCSISGFNRNRVIGHTHNIIRDPELPDDTVCSLWRTIRSGNTWKGEIKSRRKDGSVFWTQMTIVPVFNETGKPIRYVWVRYDITGLKQTETQLRTARQKADQQLIDNVHHAASIQHGLFSPEEELTKIFPSSFLIFSPKHTVSGDFYWYRKLGEESVIALGDGTGHGVSAAFISLMALTGLKYAVDEMRITEPGLVLSQLNSFLYRATNKHNNSGVAESVDLSLCRFNHETRILTYSTAKGRLYLVRDGELVELSHNCSSIGAEPREKSRIESHTLQLQTGDRIFMLSDGLPDQFGGERDKRFGSRNVKELLLFTSYAEMSMQKEVILKNYLLWRGDNEQTDDLSMIGFMVE